MGDLPGNAATHVPRRSQNHSARPRAVPYYGNQPMEGAPISLRGLASIGIVMILVREALPRVTSRSTDGDAERASAGQPPSSSGQSEAPSPAMAYMGLALRRARVLVQPSVIGLHNSPGARHRLLLHRGRLLLNLLRLPLSSPFQPLPRPAPQADYVPVRSLTVRKGTRYQGDREWTSQSYSPRRGPAGRSGAGPRASIAAPHNARADPRRRRSPIRGVRRAHQRPYQPARPRRPSTR